MYIYIYVSVYIYIYICIYIYLYMYTCICIRMSICNHHSRKLNLCWAKELSNQELAGLCQIDIRTQEVSTSHDKGPVHDSNFPAEGLCSMLLIMLGLVVFLLLLFVLDFERPDLLPFLDRACKMQGPCRTS